MASSVTSRGISPNSPYDYESTGDTDESWQYISSTTGSIGFLPSPASGSLSEWAVVSQVNPSPSALSPLYLDASDSTNQFVGPSLPEQADAFLSTSASVEASFGIPAQTNEQMMTPQTYLFTNEELSSMASFFNAMPPSTLTELGPMGVPEFLPPDSNATPWVPSDLLSDPAANTLVIGDLPTVTTPVSDSSSPSNISLKSPQSRSGSEGSKSTFSIRKVKTGKVEKKQPDQVGKFVIVTPHSINAQAGRTNMYECFDAHRATQRGRKGPLANETKASALQVRRLGACFCCHSRKVKCDKERPCKNCKKLMVQVPQVVCWQFPDFLTVLFPEFIRLHFRKEKMAQFVDENIGEFKIDGVEKLCAVELTSGGYFSATLNIRAKFFTAKRDEVLKHWHMQEGTNGISMQSRGAAPIGFEPNNAAMRDEVKKRTKEYIQALTREPYYAEQTTDAIRHTDLPQRVIRIVQKYFMQVDSPILRRAMSIYTMHYVMTRQLCMTPQNIQSLSDTNLVPQNSRWVTPRVLNRQVKSIIDDLLIRDMQHLFDHFSKSLKPKSRRDWAPCLASFLVLCLFMESVETATENFAISENEVCRREHRALEYKRKFSLDICTEIENMPFKQFAYQFHQIYQTHTKDASSKAFNPLVDQSLIDGGDLDGPAVELVLQLRELIQGPSWTGLHFLSIDPVAPALEDHPFPRDVSVNYTGRLVSKFLLSFTDEKYIFENPA